jgi:hypothetical protein
MKPYLPQLLLMLLMLPLTHAVKSQSVTDALLIQKTQNFDLTGSGSAPEWAAADWIPLEKRKGSADYKTRAKLLYSETGLYVLFSCEDEKITSTLKEDFANLWTEDVVEIFLWTDEGVPLYFEYELSPFNYELPILIPNMDGKFLGWRPWQYEGERKTRHATKILGGPDKPTEWLAEFFIPFVLLQPLRNVPPGKGVEWRMNMYRVDYDKQYTSWSWKPVEKNFHDFEKFGTVRFE